MELSNLIRTRRELKGIARTTFAKMAGVSPNSMVKYEISELEGGKIPGTANLAKICELLEIDPRDAFDAIYRGILLKKVKSQSKKQSDKSEHKTLFSFSHHFTTDDEWHKMSLSVKDWESLESYLHNVSFELHQNDKRLERIEKSLKQNSPDQDDPSRTENPDENAKAVGAASTSHDKGGG